MYMTVEIYQVAVRLDSSDNSGKIFTIIQLMLKRLADSLVSGLAEFTQKRAIVPKKNSETFWYGKNPLLMGHAGKHFTDQPLTENERTLLLTRGAAPPLLAGIRHEELRLALGASGTGEAILQIATPQKILDGFADYRAPEPETLLVPFRIGLHERIEEA